MKTLLYSLLFFACLPLMSDTAILNKLVPEAKDYEVIYELNPIKFNREYYKLDRAEGIKGEMTRLAYFLRLVNQDDSESWVFVSLDPFTQNPSEVGVPEQGIPNFQQYVTNLEVLSNVPGLKTGKIEKGNIEFWPFNYGGTNAKSIPGADGSYDFGDSPSKNGSYTSMQICNYQDKQVIFAFNAVNSGPNADLGIGNNTKLIKSNGTVPNIDWTFAGNAGSYKDAQMLVLGKFNNFQYTPVANIDTNKIYLIGITDKKEPFYKVGEEISIKLYMDFGGQEVTKPYYFNWELFSDDGKEKYQKGRQCTLDGPVTIKTTLDKPGFVRLLAYGKDSHNRNITKKNKSGSDNIVFFDGGAGADIDKLQGPEEPADFDEFWAKQRARLDAVPYVGLATMTPCPSDNPKVKIFAVSVPCAGPRPVTGYLTIPADAKPKSLAAYCSYHGYNARPLSTYQRPPKNGSETAITFNVNAHGYDLGKDNAYAEEFFKGINVDGTTYAFSPKLNANPETAYFNGMALRVMRSLQFVMSLPEWNGKDLIASGGSQGGLQTTWAAGLEPKVTVANAGIPWCCDMSGKETFGRIHGNWRIVGTPALAYYDPINIAKRVAKSCHFTVTRAGIGDYTCPPSGVAILYNNLKCKKTINWVQGSTHGFVPPYKECQKVTYNADAQ